MEPIVLKLLNPGCPTYAFYEETKIPVSPKGKSEEPGAARPQPCKKNKKNRKWTSPCFGLSLPLLQANDNL